MSHCVGYTLLLKSEFISPYAYLLRQVLLRILGRLKVTRHLRILNRQLEEKLNKILIKTLLQATD